jgi:phosphate uptake regulator
VLLGDGIRLYDAPGGDPVHLQRDGDDPTLAVNLRYRGMLEHVHVMEAAHDPRVLEWGIRMYVVSRQIERVGDNAVDIAEQVDFVVSGQFREFTDASHPEVEHPELSATGT